MCLYIKYICILKKFTFPKKVNFFVVLHMIPAPQENLAANPSVLFPYPLSPSALA